MITIFLILFLVILLRFFLSISRFLNCLIILEKFKVLLLLFCLLYRLYDNHIIFIILIILSTVEIIVGLVTLTRVWECSSAIELISF